MDVERGREVGSPPQIIHKEHTLVRIKLQEAAWGSGYGQGMPGADVEGPGRIFRKSLNS